MGAGRRRLAPLWALALALACTQPSGQAQVSSLRPDGKHHLDLSLLKGHGGDPLRGVTIIPPLGTVPVVRALSPEHQGRVCSTWGDFHYKTFDGDVFRFPGLCNYVFSSHCGAAYEDFNVQLRRGRESNATTLLSVTMKLDGLVVQLTKSSVLVNSRPVQLPFSQSGVLIELSGGDLKVVARLGLVFMWNQDDSLLLELDPKYANKTCGLCGDFNGHAVSGEFLSHNVRLTPLEFGNLQKMDGPTEQCQDPAPEPERNCSASVGLCEGILLSQRFSGCAVLVDVSGYVEACRQDLCRCAHADPASCACHTLAEYSRQCAHAGGQPQDWRSPDLCPPTCPSNLRHQECGSPCVDTCSNPRRSQVCEDHCVAGCFCPEGTVLDDIGLAGCVPVSQCACMYNGVSYAPGTNYSTDCTTCTCEGGLWSCQEVPCPGTCSVLGGAHFSTFDEKQYTVHGDCDYVLTKPCDGSAFTVLAELRRCGLTDSETCLKSVTLSLGGGHTVVVVKASGEVFVNQIYTQLPVSAANVTVFRPSTFFILAQTNLGLQLEVQLVPSMQVFVRLAPALRGSTCGLCGNFNSVQADDFRTISGVVEGTAAAFLNTFKTQASCPNVRSTFEDPCSLSVENEKYAQHWCSQLTDAHGRFARCHGTVSPSTYYSNCMFDTCNCEDSEACLCAALSAYVRACAAKGVLLSGWRDGVCTKPTTTCPNSMTYQYHISTCQPTCRSLSEEDVTCHISFVPVDGCACPEGTFLDDSGKCVQATSCPCYHRGSVVPNGESVHDSGAVCTCTQGTLTCIGGPAPTPVCEAPMVYFDCRNATAGATGAGCQKSCHTLDMACYSPQCVPGCVCPDGLVEDSDGGCVAVEDCPCVHNEATYRPGETVRVGCNTCTCENRMWRCTDEPCLATCAVYGDGHFLTFDGQRYSFNGNCEYTLLQNHCGGNSSAQDAFRVVTENVPCGTTGTTCSKDIKIFLGSYELKLSNGKVDVVQRGAGQEAPYSILQMGVYLVVETDVGLELLWDRKTSIFLRLGPEFKGRVCGLCGNFDDNAMNDFTTRSQSVVGDALEFGNSWKFSPSCPDAPVPRDPCTANPYRKSWAQKQCSIINSETFAACRAHVEPAKYYEACVSDACACDSGGDCECFCTAVAAYAQACHDVGVCVSWRTPDICPLFCDYYNAEGQCTWHYLPCGAPCMRTCQNPSGRCLQDLRGLEGCYPKCPPTAPIFDEDKMQCVATCPFPPPLPSCHVQGKSYRLGDEVPSDKNCHSCLCTESGVRCTYDAEACVCTYGGQRFLPGDVIYHTTDGTGGCISALCGSNSTIERRVYPCSSSTPTPPTTFSFSTPQPVVTSLRPPETHPTEHTVLIDSMSSAASMATGTSTSKTPAAATTPTPAGCGEDCLWSPWLDVSRPGRGADSGDFETLENLRAHGHWVCQAPKAVECRAEGAPGVPLRVLGQHVECSRTGGLICHNRDQASGLCHNYQIRVLCCSPLACSTSSGSAHTPLLTSRTTKTGATFSKSTTSLSPVTTTGPASVPTGSTPAPGTSTPVHGSVTPAPGRPTPFPGSPTPDPRRVTHMTDTSTPVMGTSTPAETTLFTTSLTPATPLGSSSAPWTPVVTGKLTYPETRHNCFQEVCSWTAWMDGSYPGPGINSGDFDTFQNLRAQGFVFCESPQRVECRAQFFPNTPLVELGQSVTCNRREGLICLNRNQLPPICYNYEIRVQCCELVEVCSTHGTPKTSATKHTTTHTPSVKTQAIGTTHLASPSTRPATAHSAPFPTVSQPSFSTHTSFHTETTDCLPRCTWTKWFDVDSPVPGPRGGDMETYSNILRRGERICRRKEVVTRLQCRAENHPEVPIEQLGQVVQCDADVGLVCRNRDQQGKMGMCLNYEVRVLCCHTPEGCPTMTPVTVPSISSESVTSPTQSTSHVQTASTTSIPQTSTTSGQTRTSVSMPQTSSTSVHRPSSASVHQPSSTSLHTASSAPMRQTSSTSVRTARASSMPQTSSTSSSSMSPSSSTSVHTASSTSVPTTRTSSSSTASTSHVSTHGMTVSPTVSTDCLPRCTWTKWFDVDSPVPGPRGGDMETYSNILRRGERICHQQEVVMRLQCRAENHPEVPIEQLGQVVQCDANVGLVCRNRDQQGKMGMCLNYEVRVLCCHTPEGCPTMTPVTVPSISSESVTSLSRSTSHVQTASTTSIRTRSTTSGQTRSVPMPKSSSTSVHTASSASVPTTRTSSSSIASTSHVSTHGMTVSPTVSTDCLPRCTWTKWFDVDSPVPGPRGGDMETYSNILRRGERICRQQEVVTRLQCRAENHPEVDIGQLGQVVQCDADVGLVCRNRDQQGKMGMCLNYEVRVLCCHTPEGCPTMTPVTVPSISSESVTSLNRSTSHVQTASTTSIPQTSTTSGQTRTSVSMPQTSSTSVHRPSSASVHQPSSTSVHTASSGPMRQTSSTSVHTASSASVPTTLTSSSSTASTSHVSTHGMTVSPTVSTDCLPRCTWTKWFDVDSPVPGPRGGDMETYSNILRRGERICRQQEVVTRLQCRAENHPEVDIGQLGQVVQCDADVGLVCRNRDQQGKMGMCLNYEVRVLCCHTPEGCPTMTPVTVPSISSESVTSPTRSTSHVQTASTTSIPQTSTTSGQTRTSVSMPQTSSTSVHRPSSASVHQPSSTSVHTASSGPMPQTISTSVHTTSSAPMRQTSSTSVHTASSASVPTTLTSSSSTASTSHVSTHGMTVSPTVFTDCLPRCSWTKWFDVDSPVWGPFGGDMETYSNILRRGERICRQQEVVTRLQCRAENHPEVPIEQLGQVVQCDADVGLVCRNRDQQGKMGMCLNYEVRVLCCHIPEGCPTMTPVTVPSISSESVTSLSQSTSHVQTASTTSIRTRSTTSGQTRSVPMPKSSSTSVHTASSASVPTTLTSSSSTASTSHVSTHGMTVSPTVSTDCLPRCTWTKWFDVDSPVPGPRGGDMETYSNILRRGERICHQQEVVTRLQCRAENHPEVPIEQLGQVVQCDADVGLVCRNRDQQGKMGMCLNYEVRVLCCHTPEGCPTMTPVTVPSISSESVTSPTRSTSHVQTASTTSIPQTSTTSGQTRTSVSMPQTSSTSVHRPSSASVHQPSSTSVHTASSAPMHQTSSTSVRTARASSMPQTSSTSSSSMSPSSSTSVHTASSASVPTTRTSSSSTASTSHVSTHGMTVSPTVSTDCLPRCTWTKWFDVDSPVPGPLGGDMETYSNILRRGERICRQQEVVTRLQCRAENHPEVDIGQLGQVVQCDADVGLVCRNRDQQGKMGMCLNYEVRVLCCHTPEGCPTMTPVTVPSISSESVTSLSRSTSHVQTASTTSIPQTSTTSGQTRTSVSMPQTSSTSVHKPSSGPMRQTSSTSVHTASSASVPATRTSSSSTASTSHVSTHGMTVSPTVSTDCLPRCTWTKWFDVDSPVPGPRGGDMETYSNILRRGERICRRKEVVTRLQCRAENHPEVPIEQLGQVVQCDADVGLVCRNRDQQGKMGMCLNYEVRVLCCHIPEGCPTMTPVTVPSISSESVTSLSQSTSHVQTASTTSIRTRSTTSGQTRSVPMPKSSSTSVHTASSASVPTTLTSSSSTASTSHVSTHGMTVSPTVSTDCLPQCTWTKWFDVDSPVPGPRGGDMETYSNILRRGERICHQQEVVTRLQCRAENHPEVPIEQLGQVVQCDADVGLVCRNRDQHDKMGMCLNYEVRVLCCHTPEGCPTMTPVTVPSISSESVTSPTRSTSHVQTASTTSIPQTSTTSGQTRTSVSMPQTSSTSVHTASSGPMRQTSSTSVHTASASSMPQTSSSSSSSMSPSSSTFVHTASSTTKQKPSSTSVPITSTTSSSSTASTSHMFIPGTTFSSPVSTHCVPRCTWTKWFDVDSPVPGPLGGDMETYSNILRRGERICRQPEVITRLQCRAENHPEVVAEQLGQVVHCDPDVGLVCRNRDQPGTLGMCLNYEVRVLCCETPEGCPQPSVTSPAKTSSPPSSPAPSLPWSSRPASPSAPTCFCNVTGKLYAAGSIIYRQRDLSGHCFYAQCSQDCEVVRSVDQDCPSAMPPITHVSSPSSSTSAPVTRTSCTNVVPPRMKGDTWHMPNCTQATCEGDQIISLSPRQCPEVEVPTCANGYPAVKVADQDGCCHHYHCQCVCSGWGDPHYITFDGTYYTFLDNCTYVLVQQIVPVFGHFRVLVDNYFCDLVGSVSCPQSLIVEYHQDRVVLTRRPVGGVMTNQIIFNNKVVSPGFQENGIAVSRVGIKMYVTIREIGVQVMFSGLIFSVEVPFSTFSNNTEGQCGTCTNDQKDECRLPGGAVATSCSEMAGRWKVTNPNQPFCYGPPPAPTSAVPSTPPTQCPPSPICQLVLSSIFQPCHAVVPPMPFFKGCVFDHCHLTDPEVVCSGLELYASLCAAHGVCVDWRGWTNSTCPLTCPSDKVYQPCGPSSTAYCHGKDTSASLAVLEAGPMTEGCFCPDNTTLFSTKDHVCVSAHCRFCVGPQGEPVEPGHTVSDGCQDCTCEGATLTLTCRLRPCPLPAPCPLSGFVMVPVPPEPGQCCPTFSCACNSSYCPKPRACPRGSRRIVTHEEGACCPSQSCRPTCSVHYKDQIIRQQNCSSVRPVSLSYCQGNCGETGSMYPPELSTAAHRCRCCQELQTSQRNVTLRCADGSSQDFSYTQVEKCGCRGQWCRPLGDGSHSELVESTDSEEQSEESESQSLEEALASPAN